MLDLIEEFSSNSTPIIGAAELIDEIESDVKRLEDSRSKYAHTLTIEDVLSIQRDISFRMGQLDILRYLT